MSLEASSRLGESAEDSERYSVAVRVTRFSDRVQPLWSLIGFLAPASTPPTTDDM